MTVAAADAVPPRAVVMVEVQSSTSARVGQRAQAVPVVVVQARPQRSLVHRRRVAGAVVAAPQPQLDEGVGDVAVPAPVGESGRAVRAAGPLPQGYTAGTVSIPITTRAAATRLNQPPNIADTDCLLPSVRLERWRRARTGSG